MWPGLLDLLFPPRCAGCGSRGEAFCGACRGRLQRLSPPLCPLCGGPAQARRTEAQGPHRLPDPPCLACRRMPPAFSMAYSLFVYDGVLRQAIRAVKYRRHRAAGHCLGRMLADLAPPEAGFGTGAVVPVPLHPARLAARGYNQAELLARPLARRLGVPCLGRLVCRLHQDSSQTGLDAAARRENVRGAFRATAPVPAGAVLLVDDVFSTGATADACARALLRAGARSVTVLTLARAVLEPAGKTGPDTTADRAYPRSRDGIVTIDRTGHCGSAL